MTIYNQPHEVRDQAKLQSMIDTLHNGGQLPPIVVCGYDAFTGSHRIAAWSACGMDHQAVEISETEYITAMCKVHGIDYDPSVDDRNEIVDLINEVSYGHIEYNDFCDALYSITKNPEVKAALEDQIDN